jgi:hypothetical protein
MSLDNQSPSISVKTGIVPAKPPMAIFNKDIVLDRMAVLAFLWMDYRYNKGRHLEEMKFGDQFIRINMVIL